MPFIEAAPYITEMLQIFIGYTPDNEFINRIYKDCLIYKDNIYKLNYNPIPLSQREIEIITLIDQGLSRKQISEQLYISQETAKTHLKNIYLKLEVGDKVSALRVAKARGFLNT
jgi:LuxR family maltose regulon positive regulatory protein